MAAATACTHRPAGYRDRSQDRSGTGRVPPFVVVRHRLSAGVRRSRAYAGLMSEARRLWAELVRPASQSAPADGLLTKLDVANRVQIAIVVHDAGAP
jgi:hypothetical protein